MVQHTVPSTPVRQGRPRILVVIPGRPDGHEFPFSRRQAAAFEQDHGAAVAVYFLQDRLSLRALLHSAREFRELQAEFKPDIVHVHYGTVTAMFAVLVASVPVVITFHGSDLNPTPSDGRLRDLAGRCLSQLAALFAAGRICVSERLRDRLWWRRQSTAVVPIGIDVERFRPMDRDGCRASLGWSNEKKVVLFNANNPALKRYDIATRVIGSLTEQGMPVRLEVLRGGIPVDRMPVLLNAADVLLLCSDQEGSPTMVKEAMACTLPVVSSDVGDVVFRTRGVIPGAVVAQDAAALARALKDVLLDGRRSNGREMADANGLAARTSDAETLRYIESRITPRE